MENKYNTEPKEIISYVEQSYSPSEVGSSLDEVYAAGLEKVCLDSVSCRFE